MLRRFVIALVCSGLAVLVIAQFFQPERSNPRFDRSAAFVAVARPPRHIASILSRACRDCHSNETVWPWYSRISPVSWWIAKDVQKGRARLNFSEWDRVGPEMAQSRLRDVCEQVRQGEMPPLYYVPLHRAARLSQREIDALCVGWRVGRARASVN